MRIFMAVLAAWVLVAQAPLPADLQAIKITATGTLTPQLRARASLRRAGLQGLRARRFLRPHRVALPHQGLSVRRRSPQERQLRLHGQGPRHRRSRSPRRDRARAEAARSGERNASRDRRHAARHRAVPGIRHPGLCRQAAQGRGDLGMESRHRRGREALAVVGLHGSRARSIGAHGRRMAARQLAVRRSGRQHPAQFPLHQPGDLDRAGLEIDPVAPRRRAADHRRAGRSADPPRSTPPPSSRTIAS